MRWYTYPSTDVLLQGPEERPASRSVEALTHHLAAIVAVQLLLWPLRPRLLRTGAAISLEAGHREIRVESLKLLHKVSLYIGAGLEDAVGGHLSSLLRVISQGGGVIEEQAAAVCSSASERSCAGDVAG
jgi:hypothetical protein